MRVVVAVWLSALLAGCTPTCDQVCDHIVACGNPGTELLNSEECADACLRQDALYEEWTDEKLRDGYDAALRCLDDATCTELADGACYDPEVWPY